MNDPKTLEISQRGKAVAQITMSRPDVFNAFDETMIGELDAAFDQLINDAGVRVIVLLKGRQGTTSPGAEMAPLDLEVVTSSICSIFEWSCS